MTALTVADTSVPQEQDRRVQWMDQIFANRPNVSDSADSDPGQMPESPRQGTT